MADTKTNLITKEDVEKVADLAKLHVSSEEEKFASLLSDTVEYIKVLDELDTSTTEETYQVTGLTNIFQNPEDKSDSLTQEEALSNAKIIENNLIGTDPVFERE